MKVLYTDNIEVISQLNLEYKLLKPMDWNQSLNSIFLIYNKKFDIKTIQDKGFIITLFESVYSDFEILNFDSKLIKDRLDYFYKIIMNTNFIKNNTSSITDIEKDEIKNIEIDDSDFVVEKFNQFKGIYVNNILMKTGNIRFIHVFEIVVFMYKHQFTGELSITKRASSIYSLYFLDGKLTNIKSLKESDNFQYFLKKYGYISKINKEIYLYPVKKQLDLFISNNDIFKHEKNIIYKDYIGFLFRNIITLDSGEFEILNDNSKNNIFIFSDYLSFLYNFINYFKNKKLSFQNFKISESIENKLYKDHFNEEVLSFLIEIKNGRNKTDLFKIFNKHSRKYVESVLLFFMIIGLIDKNDENDFIRVKSKSINEDISKRIEIWLEKIKKENYFSLLGININDNEDFIEDKFRNLFSQFSNYLSSEDIRVRYRNDLEDIIFELEAAYNVVINKELKEKYYNGMLK